MRKVRTQRFRTRGKMRSRYDPARLLAPFGAAFVALAVALALGILTHVRHEGVVFAEIAIAREEESVERLEEVVESTEAPQTVESSDAESVDIAVDLPSVESVADALPSVLPTLAAVVAPPPPAQTVQMITSPVTMKTLAGAARSGGARQAAIGRHGGTGAAEASVMRALRWLKTQQREDGSWRAHGEGDATAFALLAFLSHGESFASREFGAVVKRAVLYLVTRRSKNNMSAYALAEAAAVIRTPVLKEAAEAAVEDLCRRQKGPVKANAGGVVPRYCAVMALKSAQLAHLRVPSLDERWQAFDIGFAAMRDARRGHEERIRGKGTWHYMVAGVCLQYLGRGEEEATEVLMRRLAEIWPPATLGTTEIACCPVRSNYFSTMMFFNAGGDVWKRWNDGMLAAYAETQTIEADKYVDEDGVSHEIGYWHCKDEHIGEQPFWTTCYVAHQLMVYYRYLPTYSKEAWRETPRTPPARPVLPGVDIEVDI